MKKLLPQTQCLKILFLIAVVLVISSCTKNYLVSCKDFSAVELAWMPYNEGETITFKSDSGSIITFIVGQKENSQESGETRHGIFTFTRGIFHGSFCRNKTGMHLNSGDSIKLNILLENTNEKDHKSKYADVKNTFYVWVGGNKFGPPYESVGGTVTPPSLTGETIVINGITYYNVLVCTHENYQFNHNYFNKNGNLDTLYYTKNTGYIAFHKQATNEWFYKQ